MSNKDQREPYVDEDHLYHKYEMMKMANERNMKEKFKYKDKLDKLIKAVESDDYNQVQKVLREVNTK